MLLKNDLSNKKNRNILIVILIAALLRLPFLATIPNGFFIDEAANGYEAYSILATQHDSYGKFMPLVLRAMDDYRTALYTYITIPFIKLLGLNEFATRIPAALIGILTVIILYYLVKECFNQKIALLAAFFLAISPWHIQFSRIAFEAILFPFLFCLSLLFFLKSLRQANYLILSAITFSLCTLTYFSARLFVPLFIICLVFVFRNNLWRIKKQTLIASTVFIIFFIPIVQFWLSPEGMARARLTGVTINPATIWQNYLLYFSPKFLFLSGDPNLRHSTGRLGELYLFEVITILIGIFFLIIQNKKEHQMLLCWLLLYPIPAAFTAPEHAIRSIIGAPLFAILSAYGIYKIYSFLSYNYKKIFKFIAILIVSLSLIWYCKSYFLDYPKHSNEAWLFGMKEAITYAENSSNNCVIVSNRTAYSIPMSYLILFYTQYPPNVYQRSPISVFSEKSYSVGKYHVAVVPESQDIGAIGQQLISIWNQQKVLNNKCLFVIKPDEMKKIRETGYDWHQVHEISNPDGTEAIALIEVTRQ